MSGLLLYFLLLIKIKSCELVSIRPWSLLVVKLGMNLYDVSNLASVQHILIVRPHYSSAGWSTVRFTILCEKKNGVKFRPDKSHLHWNALSTVRPVLWEMLCTNLRDCIIKPSVWKTGNKVWMPNNHQTHFFCLHHPFNRQI